jgi:RNA polymerase sigma-70 factor, ECF subfamily
MAVTIDDTEIVKRLHDSKQCREAFTEIIKTYSEPLYWQIRRMVMNHDDANDLLQNTFLKAWSNIENFRGDAKLSTWLYKIAINESITFINKEKQKQNISIDDEHNMFQRYAIFAELSKFRNKSDYKKL